MALPIDTPAPDFALKTSGGERLKEVRLSDNFGNGNTVLLFFPGAFTPVCTQQMCDMTASLKQYERLNATVYGITNDTPYVLDEWARQNRIAIRLLSDFQKEVSQAYDVVWPDFSGLGPGTARAAFVIDKEGVIRYSEQTPTLRDLPDCAAIQRLLATL
jgi:peroxiredoxin